MKISLSWVFDHINASFAKVDIDNLVDQFNKKVAEIEGWYAVETDLDSFALGRVQKVTANQVSVEIPEWGQTVRLAKRPDLQESHYYLITKKNKKLVWATSCDLGAHKEMLLPALHCSASQLKGSWKKSFETKDYILEVDNKSITHRPDMWGHRGFAREIALLLNKKLRSLDGFLENAAIDNHEHSYASTKTMPFELAIEDPEKTKRFAGCYLSTVKAIPSWLWMVTRLSRVDSRAIDALVDCTNYVMLDISQPMHVFDAAKLENKKVVARQARNKEKLTLLDNQKIELTNKDIVIADGQKPISLAGIMGGASTGVSPSTKSVFLESANFDAATIRRSSVHHKVRSEASARFEKSLDPNQNVTALKRFLKLLNHNDVAYKGGTQIISLGAQAQGPEVIIEHRFIEQRLGVTIAPSFVIHTLKALGFGVYDDCADQDPLVYTIKVPLYRATKDVHLKEDIVEEVGRFYGYDVIPAALPYIQSRPTNQRVATRIYNIKHMLAFGMRMHEISSYTFFDESFLRELEWDPQETEQVQDPVSENWYRLATTLAPHLFKAVQTNMHAHDTLRFFEWGRVWRKKGRQLTEKKMVSGIFYNKKKKIDFYQAKADMQQFFAMMGLQIFWESMAKQLYPWCDQEQTAHLFYQGEYVGCAGIVASDFFKKIGDGFAFLFELDGDWLESCIQPPMRFKPLSKYPAVERDISLMVPRSVSAGQMQTLIAQADAHIISVDLQDFFEKKEWKDSKSLTFRYCVRNPDRTMTKEEIDAISNKVHSAVKTAGAEIR